MIAAKQKFFVTGIIELTPKTLQNYGFVNIALTPRPLFPQSYHSGGFDDKRVVLGRRKKKLELQVMNKCFNSSHKK